jgi:oxygen-independent coproporphyrinogen-3 oxidase
VYVHVPFCQQRCGFCRFYPGPHTGGRADAFVDVALREIELWASVRSADPDAAPVEAVFVGGGSPSSLSVDQLTHLLRRILTTFTTVREPEVTVEWYPRDTSAEKLAGARSAGMTRISVGAQSWNERTLRSLGSHHGAEDVDGVLLAAAEAGIGNVNVDLMANVPGQELDEHLLDVDRAIAAGATMVSVNLLELAAGSPLARLDGGEAPDDVKRSWLAASSELLRDGSYQPQRVRNFFRDGGLHLYNRASAGIAFDIVPIGPGAYGFVGGWPVINTTSFDEWQRRLGDKWDGVAGYAAPTDDEMRRAFVVNSLLELRLDGAAYRAAFGSDLLADFPIVAELLADGVLAGIGDVLELSPEACEFGDDISVEVFSDFQRQAFDLHLAVGRRRGRSQYFPAVRIS